MKYNNTLNQILPFQYFNTLLSQMIKGERPSVKRLYLSGSRKSGKTRAYENFVISALLHKDISADAYLIRNQQQDAGELFNDMKEISEELEIDNLITNQTRKTIKYYKDYARVLGIETTKKRTGKSTAKLGLKSGKNKTYGIIVFEEAYEMDEDAHHALLETIRGYKYLIIIYASNPWSIMNWYVALVSEKLPQIEAILKTKHQQFKYDAKNRELIHHTTYKLNPFVSEDEREQLEQLEIRDPNRARVSVYGMAGIAEGAVYSGYYERILPLQQNPNWEYKTDYFTGGIDWGERRDTTAAQLWAVGYNFEFVAGLDEYTHTNKHNPLQKTNADMISDILDFYIRAGNKYGKIRRNGLRIYVDYSATAIIEYLNIEAKNRGADKWLYFVSCIKYPIRQRIDHFTLAMRLGKFFIDFKRMPALCKELQNAQYDDKGDRLDLNDHSINTKEYALAYEMTKLTRGYDLAFQNV